MASTIKCLVSSRVRQKKAALLPPRTLSGTPQRYIREDVANFGNGQHLEGLVLATTHKWSQSQRISRARRNI